MKLWKAHELAYFLAVNYTLMMKFIENSFTGSHQRKDTESNFNISLFFIVF